jgi:hypothetical protein
MATNRFCIESFMDEMELKYFTREEQETAWIVMFGPSTGVLLHLAEDGEYLMFRSLPVLDRKMLSVEKNNRLNAALLKLNEDFKLGHYCGDEQISIEAVLPIEDAELTAKQFHRCLAIVCGEAMKFKKRLPGLIGDEAPSEEDSIGELIQRLIDDSSGNE